jgi:hypothetical protein
VCIDDSIISKGVIFTRLPARIDWAIALGSAAKYRVAAVRAGSGDHRRLM